MLEILTGEALAGSPMSALVKASGVGDPIQKAIAQSGLPPEAFNFAQGILSGKGSVEDKLQQAAGAAQAALSQLAGPAGQISDLVKGPLMSALGIEPSAVGKISGVAGTAIGTLLAGPLGGAVGGFISETVVGGIADALSTSPTERDAKRSRDDLIRALQFAHTHGLDTEVLGKEHQWKKNLVKWSTLFHRGVISVTKGVPGGKRERWGFRSGKFKKLSPGEVAYGDKVANTVFSPTDAGRKNARLVLSSARMSGRFLAAMSGVEAKAVATQRAKTALEIALADIKQHKQERSADQARLAATEKRITAQIKASKPSAKSLRDERERSRKQAAQLTKLLAHQAAQFRKQSSAQARALQQQIAKLQAQVATPQSVSPQEPLPGLSPWAQQLDIFARQISASRPTKF
jgi:hypothetical protein